MKIPTSLKRVCQSVKGLSLLSELLPRFKEKC